ncbi:hypothetical protein AB1284_25685 [Bacillus sp. S2(2024)]|uniref:hypothetical protein n=1 Tax=Bacillus sp. S2(2024) TaxID=3162887 RepID=UPI003D22375A
MKKKIGFILGIIGSILGIICSLFVLLIGYVNDMGAALETTNGTPPINKTTILGLISLALSILGIIGSIITRKKEKNGY